MSQSFLDHLQDRIAPLRREIVHHKVYSAIKDIESLQVFMQYHVYAVWDFMSLLKVLQRNLTCVDLPWFPVGDADTRYLINEIVTGEESDIDQDGNRKSHFELYLDAMQQCGAGRAAIDIFGNTLKQGSLLAQAFTAADTPAEARSFVNYTFEVINGAKKHVQSAVFTFGREDLIPDMFLSIVRDIHTAFPDRVSVFKYYLERHIEVDGDHHSNLALQMTSRLCTTEEQWLEAENAVVQALQHRILLWDGVYRSL